MRNIKLIVEYDGANYAGWQIQPNGLSIQQVLEDALAGMLGERVRVHSSGRTDAGVHALGMVAAFMTSRALPLRAFREGLNALLPADIAIREAEEAGPDFNPRFAARGKHYRYSIWNGARRSPLSRQYAWHVRNPLDLELMGRAARLFVGEHDFGAFRTSGCAAKTTVRRIDAVEVGRDGGFVRIDVFGSGFLKNMVRLMVGTLVEVGHGQRPPEDIGPLLERQPGCRAGATAPSHGLCLVEVFY